MPEICEKCGLPKDLCICQEITREQQRLIVKIETRRFNKEVTVVSGFEPDTDLRDVASSLKSKCACGGTFDKEQKKVELQGNHLKNIDAFLKSLGFENVDMMPYTPIKKTRR